MGTSLGLEQKTGIICFGTEGLGSDNDRENTHGADILDMVFLSFLTISHSKIEKDEPINPPCLSKELLP